jgi:inorganic pyrophosphatase
MSNLAAAPNKWNPGKSECKVIIETPKGRRNKFTYDPEYELFALGRVLAQGLVFPYDFGFIPSTSGGDEDPLDVMVLMDEPAHVGCLLDVRLIGVIEAEQTEEGETIENHRLIAVSQKTFTHQDVTDLEQVSGTMLDQVEEFFITYNKSRVVQFRVKGRHGRKRAAEILEIGIKKFEKEAR